MEPKDLAFTSKGVFVAKELVSNEGSSRLKKSNLSPKELLYILDETLREVCKIPWYICQPAVRRSVGILTFSPSMKNHSAYNIQIYMSVKETRYLNLLDT